MINLNNVTKYYDVNGHKNYVLKNCSFQIPENVSVGILGLNGAGKSTFIKLLGGTDYPNKGNITSDEAISWPLGLANAFQSSLSGADNVKFVCRIHASTREQMREKIAFVKDFAEIGDYFYMPISSYSSGMKSRLAFGLSMAFDFDIYLIDEILSVGDKDFKKKCHDIMEQKRSKSSIIMVSHDLKNMQEMCSAGIVMRNNNLEYFEDIKDAIKAYND